MNIVPKNNLSEPAPVLPSSVSTKRDLSRRSLGEGGRAFTLVELLVVISIIGVLAALIIPVAGTVNIHKKINTAQAELQGLESDLENYKAKYGVYPPGNGTNYVVNQLYYELSGATNNNGSYITLDGNSTVSAVDYGNQFNQSGLLNCTKPAGDETVYAKNFLPGIKANEISFATNSAGKQFYYLVTSVGGPDVGYQPIPGYSANPFRYAYPGINNPNSYDLWVQLSINSTTNNPHLYLVCNWTQVVQRNSPLP
jgi:prepilin-type N-terminal cleavage/methylation domain-containing protein